MHLQVSHGDIVEAQKVVAAQSLQVMQIPWLSDTIGGSIGYVLCK